MNGNSPDASVAGPAPVVAPSVALYSARPEAPAPRGHLFASVCWLVARHPLLARLARRVPGVVDTNGDVLPWELADAVRELDEHRAAWAEYERSTPAPAGHARADEARYERWLDAGPAGTDRAAALDVMSRTELARLRLLAAFDTAASSFTVTVLDGFDDAGRDLVRDWMVAVLAYHAIPARPALPAVRPSASDLGGN